MAQFELKIKSYGSNTDFNFWQYFDAMEEWDLAYSETITHSDIIEHIELCKEDGDSLDEIVDVYTSDILSKDALSKFQISDDDIFELKQGLRSIINQYY